MRLKGAGMNKSKFQFLNPELEQVEFLVNDDFNKEACDGISIIRPIIASMTGNSKYPALNIPFIDFTEAENNN